MFRPGLCAFPCVLRLGLAGLHNSPVFGFFRIANRSKIEGLIVIILLKGVGIYVLKVWLPSVASVLLFILPRDQANQRNWL